MKKRVKIFLIVVVAGIFLGIGGVYYVFNKPHRDIEGEKPAFTTGAKALFDEYNTDEEAGNIKYGDKVIQVKGEIIDISRDNFEVSIVLNDEMEGVSCALDSIVIVENKSLIDGLAAGDEITLKGKCDGLDMIMGVVLTRCIIVDK